MLCKKGPRAPPAIDSPSHMGAREMSEDHDFRSPTHKKRPNACIRCRKRKVRCDGRLPACGHCRKASVTCERTAPSQAELLDRIHHLESLIQDPAVPEHPFPTELPQQIDPVFVSLSQAVSDSVLPHRHEEVASPIVGLTQGVTALSPVSSTSLGLQQPIAHEVGMLSLANSADPKYLGPSSGVSFARLLYAAAPQTQGLPSNTSVQAQTDGTTQYAKPSPLPPSKDIRRFLNAYFTTLHPFYPFLDQAVFLKTAEEVRSASQTRPQSQQGGTAPVVDNHAAAQLYLVVFLGAKLLEFKLSCSFNAESYLSTAMVHVAVTALHDSQRGMQTLLLLILASLHSPNGLNAWFLRSSLIAGVVDLGLHRKIQYTEPNSWDSVKHHDVRSGIFWSAYSLDRTLSVVLGRPLTLRDEAFDVGFPGDPNADEIQRDASNMFEEASDAAEPYQKRGRYSMTPSTPAAFSFRFDRIVAESKFMLHRVCQSPARFPWPTDFSAWQTNVHKACTKLLDEIYREYDRIDVPGSSIENVIPTLELKYHHTIMLLYRPSPSIPRPSVLALRFCFESAMETIRIYSELFRTGNLINSWLDAHTTFIAGITVCYCLWMSPQIRQVTPANLFNYYTNMTKHLLEAFSRTWSVAAGACEKFGALAEWTKTSFEQDMTAEVIDPSLGPQLESDHREWPEMPTLPLDDNDLDWAAMTIDYDNTTMLPEEFQEVPDWFALEAWLKDMDTLT